MTNKEKTKLQKMISDGKIQQAIDVLLATELNESDKKKALTIASRHKQLKQDINSDSLSFDQQNLTRNQIITRLLDIIEPPSNQPFQKEKSTNNPHSTKTVLWKYITAAAVVIGIFGSLAEIFNFINLFPDHQQTEKHQLTIFVTDVNGNVVLAHSGELNTSIGNRPMRETIGEDGRTNFGDILPEHLGDTITIGFHAEGWEIADGNNSFVFTGKPIRLKIKKDDSLGIIKGVVKSKDGQEFIEGARVLINADTTVLTDAQGVFKLVLPSGMQVNSPSESYKLTITKDDFEAVSYYFFPKTHAEISLPK